MTALLQVKHLNKHYPGFTLKDVSFSVEPGRIMGLIGKNGAGKSTTLKSIFKYGAPGIRNRFPPAASAPPGKPGKSETKSGKDCGLATDSGSASRKNKQTTIFEHRFASYSSRESFRIRKMESETTTFDKCRNGLNSELPHRKIQ